jgi:molecular chaperone DnaJ
LSGQGASGEQGAPPGDLYVVVKVQPDTRFEREGGNLRRDQTISFAKAALGGKERVPTLAGNVNLTIPPGTQSGRVFRLKGQGMPRLNGRGKGDLLVRVEVKVPQNLSDEQKELIRRLDELDHSG